MKGSDVVKFVCVALVAGLLSVAVSLGVAAAEGVSEPVAPPAIRIGDVPDTHPAFLYDDGETLWFCAMGLDPDYTVCEKAVVYPAGSFGF